MFEGLPADLIAARNTLTGEHLAEYIGAGASTGDGKPSSAEAEWRPRLERSGRLCMGVMRSLLPLYLPGLVHTPSLVGTGRPSPGCWLER